MDGNIARHAGTTPVRGRERGQREAGAGRSVHDEQGWSEKVLTLDDLVVALPPGGGPVLGNAIVQLPGVRKCGRVDGPPRFVQRRVGWLAQRDRIVVIENYLELRARPDGKFAPLGRWNQHTVDVLGTTALPQRTVGEVRDDALTGVDPRAGTSSVSLDEMLRDPMLASGMLALSYLPHDVRLGVVQAVPAPSLCVGQAVRHADSTGAVSRHEVRLLSLQGRQAVVVVAATHGSSGWWQVEQVAYHLTDSPSAALTGELSR